MIQRKQRGFAVNLLRKARISFLRIYYARGSAHEIALGAAIGAFWGVFPTFGLSTILSLSLYKFFRFNIIAAISAAFISNPITSPLWLYTSYMMGKVFTKTEVVFSKENWTESIGDLGLTMLIGSVIISSTTAVIVYYLFRYMVLRKRNVAQ
ncbi:MAG: DUF2062 domain-containing protein [Bacteroidia bacterium]|nr:DUF2062 domain-containing protein [Bacteroidia bacterium]